jgi:hypothetical protein
VRQARSRRLGRKVDGRLALAARSRAGAVATDDILLTVTAGVCGASAGAIVISIAGAFVLVLGACAADRTLACPVLAYTDGLLEIGTHQSSASSCGGRSDRPS